MRGLPPAHQSEVLEKQVVDFCSHVCLDRFMRGIHDWLAFDIEAGVENHLATRHLPHVFEEQMEIRIVAC
jgi:hypothetical protein